MSSVYESKTLDHLGLVAAMVDELELVQQIDQVISQDFEQRVVSIGQAVKAMVLNGLGFANQRLYLVPQFFHSKPTERLIGPGIKAEHLNDDTLGRALDALYDYGVTELFSEIAAHAASRLGLTSRFIHLDSTSFHVDGRYNSEAGAEEGVIHVRQGYSRDHRPELNQVVLEMMVEQQAGLPILMKPLSGNSSDQGDFPKLIEAHMESLQLTHGVNYVVSDCALYSAGHIKALDDRRTRFVTRVPETIKEAQHVVSETDLNAMEPLVEGYRYSEVHSEYGSVAQRWLVIHSKAAQERARKSVNKQFLRQSEKEAKALEKLMRQAFSCQADALQALAQFEATLKRTRIEGSQVLEKAHHEGAGRPARGVEPQRFSYHISASVSSSLAKRDEAIVRKSLFILTTNELDHDALSNQELLAAYKGQARVERGFRFLKDPLFLASSFFLKSEKRIMALLMVMTLCLLVYAALEWRIREGLRQQDQNFIDQKGQPTQRPSARWVFQYFVGIHLLLMAQQQLVLNLNEQHRVILAVLGPTYQLLYSSHPT